MRVFDHMNTDGRPCPICETKEDKPVVLIGVSGTQDGNIMEAVQIHVDCLDFVYHKAMGIIFGSVDDMKKEIEAKKKSNETLEKIRKHTKPDQLELFKK